MEVRMVINKKDNIKTKYYKKIIYGTRILIDSYNKQIDIINRQI